MPITSLFDALIFAVKPVYVIAPKAERKNRKRAEKMSRKKSESGESKIWGGRFDAPPDAIVEEINASIHFDRKLARQDIEGSRAHAAMLRAQGLLSPTDYEKIEKGLKTILKEIESGTFAFSRALEDIHMNIESRLRDLIGPAAGRLHTARSRNDQVALDFRLYVRQACQDAVSRIETLMGAFISKAQDHTDTIMPGFTHLQCAQPITFAHHCMAYAEMLGRDRERFRDALARADECPLGACALAGTGFNIDRRKTASDLGFREPTRNSLDSVSDRDFALEFLSSACLCALHLSRFAEEIVLWSTPQFGFVSLSDGLSTGSSIMPQKKNPDIAELVRAKVGRVSGAFTALATVMKGLPLAYSKDMQEDKENVFDAAETLDLVLRATCAIVEDMKIDVRAMRQAASLGHSTATDLADWLVRELDLPFREAHHITGKAVALAEKRKCRLAELSLKDLQKLHKGITKDLFDVLSLDASVASRVTFGGTAPKAVKAQIEYWLKRLKESGK